MVKFKEIYYERYKDIIRVVLFQNLRKDRECEDIGSEYLSVLESYVDMGLIHPKPMKSGDNFLWRGGLSFSVYDNEFEEPFLAITQKYFEKKASTWEQNLSCMEYLNEVDRALNREEEIAHYWIQPKTRGILF